MPSVLGSQGSVGTPYTAKTKTPTVVCEVSIREQEEGKQGMLGNPGIPTVGRQRQKDQEFEADFSTLHNTLTQKTKAWSH